MKYRVIALDPGGTTGWSTYTADEMINPLEARTEYLKESWLCGQLGPEDHHSDLWTLLENQHVERYFVVCESFEFRGGAARVRDNLNLSSKEYIGIVKLFGQERGIVPRFQTAAMGKGFITDDKIKKAGLWAPNHRHAMDATRHLLYFLTVMENRYDLIRRWWSPS